MIRLLFRPQARADLDDIWDYSLFRWGPAQAESYLRKIQEACALFAANPAAGRDISYIRKGYRSWPCGSHVIYAEVSDTALAVVRILHKRRDVPQIL